MLNVFRRRLLTALVVLTGATVILHLWLLPPTGLTRTIYGEPGFAGDPVSEAVADDIDLAFLHQLPGLDEDRFSAQWRGVWFVPRQETVRLHLSGRGRISLELDGALLARVPADPRVRSEWTGAVSPGPHELVIAYDSNQESPELRVQWAADGGRLRPMAGAALFPGPVGEREYRTTTVLWWLRAATMAAWLALGVVALLRAVLPSIVRTARRLGRPGDLLRELRRGRAGDAVRRWRAANPPRTFRELGRRLAVVAAPALLGPVVVFLAGPHTVYSANAGEFNVPFSALVPRLVAVTSGAWAILLAVGLVVALVSRRLTRLYAAVLFGAGVLIWVQGNLLLGEYGLLTGDELDLGAEAWRDPYERALWIGVLAAAVLFSRRVANVAPFVSTVLVALQVLLVVASPLVAAGEAGGDEEEAQFERRAWREPPPELAQLSRDRNVIHIVLDSFLSHALEGLLEQDREAIERILQGFVFFPDHLGAFPTTRGSMPAMLTGHAYRNEALFIPFQMHAIERDGIFGRLARHGYQVRSVTFHHREHPPATLPGGSEAVRYSIPTPYESYAGYVESATVQLIDLSLFRHVPHRLKARVYNDDQWLLQSRYSDLDAARRNRPSNHALFLQELIGRFTATETRPVYTYIHIAVPHPPLVMDGDCRYIGRQRFRTSSYLAQARCGLTLVDRLLNRLRELGIYDRSIVVLTADHGWRLRRRIETLRTRTPAGTLDSVVQAASPLLAVKPAGSAGPLRISRAPTTVTDVPATILDLAGVSEEVTGESALRLDEDATRSREYAHHTWWTAGWQQPYFDVLWIFSVDGPVRRAESWQFRHAIFAPGENLEKRIAFKRLGLSEQRDGSDGTFLWSEPYAVAYAPADARVLTIGARKAPKPPRQTLTVRIDGAEAGRYVLDSNAWQTFRLDLPAPRPGANAFTIELILDPRYRDGNRIRGAMFRPFEWSR